MPLRKSDLQNQNALDLPFQWATGIEDTFITEPWPSNGRTLDEYALTEHYTNWEQDIDLASSLGVNSIRYGIPWYLINPSPGEWDWKWADGPLHRLIDSGIDPIVDLVHYGTPRWIDDSFANPDYPKYVAEYAYKVAERFKGTIHCYTPLNEPRITAWYCGRLGWWPPHLHGVSGYVRVMGGVCKGIVETVKAVRAVDPENVIVHVDATERYRASPDYPDLAGEADGRQGGIFLATDLILGKVYPEHPFWIWLAKGGMSESDLTWFQDNRIEIDICGINFYPMFSEKILYRAGNGVRIKTPYAYSDMVDGLATLYYERYGLPIMITETSASGSMARRSAWLHDSVSAVKRLRGNGIPLIGYTWWPLFSLVAWAYRQGVRDLKTYLVHMGLWDLKHDGEHLRRVETRLVGEYRQTIDDGV